MIEIRNNRIYFYSDNRDIAPMDFPCMSAYICPHCKKILAAYYAGTVTELGQYTEKAHHYELGGSDGGQYLLLSGYYHKEECSQRETVSLQARGIGASLDEWAKQEHIESIRLDRLAEMIEAGEVPGFDIVTDTCGLDAPILLYSQRDFLAMNNPSLGEHSKRLCNLAAYVEWVTSGDHSKPFEPPAARKESEPELSLEALEADLFSGDIEKVGGAKNNDGGDSSVGAGENGQPEPGVHDSFEVIDSYSRAQAIGDGVLIDVTETAKEAGILYPTAVTKALWNGYIVPPDSLKGVQDTEGRLWDVLTMLRIRIDALKAANASKDIAGAYMEAGQTLSFKTIFQMPSRTINPKMETVLLKSVCGPGDSAEPVITIMLINED